MSLTRIGSIGINTGIAFAGVTTIVTLNTANDALSIGATVNVGSGITLGASGDIFATGVSTFSGDLKVGSGVTISPDGDIFATGVCTATSFSGSLAASNLTGALPAISGANLTNLDASDLASGTVPTARLGSGTASSSTFLRGDSTFATVTSTTINSNTNNYLITGTGTADTLQGEANLTFDGSKLSIKGVDTSTGSGGAAAVEIKQGDANDEFVNLSLQTGSGGPLAVISAIADATGVYPNTTGQLRFSTQVGGGLFERVFIKSNGDVGINASTINRSDAGRNTIQFDYSGSDGSEGLEIRLSNSALNGNAATDNAAITYIGQDLGINNRENGNIKFFNNGSERVRIDSSGNIMFGTTSSTVYDDSSGSGVVIRGATGALDVMRDNDHPLLLNRNGGDGQMCMYHRDGTNKAASAIRGSHLCFDLPSGTEKIRFQSTGGISFNGDTATANALDDYEEGTWTPAISGVSYNDAQGTYIKIGTTCFVTLSINQSNTSKSGDTRITGLPFTSKSGSGEYYPANSVPFFEVSGISLASGYNNIYGRIDYQQSNLQLLVTDGVSHGILTAGGGTTLNSNHSMRTSFTYETAS